MTVRATAIARRCENSLRCPAVGETSVTRTSAGPMASGRTSRAAAASSADGRLTRAARTRTAVVDALLTLNERGELRPTARDIAAEAGVSLRSVYVHFDDLEALFVESSRRAHRAAGRRRCRRSSTRARLRRAARRLPRPAHGHPRVLARRPAGRAAAGAVLAGDPEGDGLGPPGAAGRGRLVLRPRARRRRRRRAAAPARHRRRQQRHDLGVAPHLPVACPSTRPPPRCGR